jgi:lipopolysaccharide transport system permease protein
MSLNTSKIETEWDVVIAPRDQFIQLGLADVWRYRDLIWMFLLRDFIAFYKQTILGPLWYLIQPVLTAITYYVIFAKIANISTNGLPPLIFYLSGVILWGYFAACLVNNGEIFSKNSHIFGKVYFPRLVVPISVALSGMIALGIQFVLLVLASAFFILSGWQISFRWSTIAVIPFLVLYVALLGMGVGLLVSALTVRYRDLAFATGFVTQLWMFASPVVYPFSQIPEKYRFFFHFNPMTSPIEGFRAALFGTPSVDFSIWISNAAIGLVVLLLGLVLFTRAESTAMDTV